MTRFLLKGGCVLTLGARTPNFDEGDVLIDGTRVAEVGRGIRARDAEVVDAAGTIVMPGFVDAHRHVWKTLFRNAGATPETTVDPRRLGADDVYASTLVGLLSAAEVGITTVVDWFDAGFDPDQTEAALQAHADAGVRTVFVRGIAEGAAPPPPSSPSERTTFAVGIADPLESERSAGPWEEARRSGQRLHVHADPTGAGVAGLGARGLLGGDVTLAHCTRLDAEDLDAIASSGAHVVLTPARDMGAGLGTPPLQPLIDRQIRPGLGVDDELLAPGDAFAQMRTAQSLQHATLFDRKLSGKAGLPSLLNTRDVIRYATIDGARTAGLGDVTGSLEAGKQADVVVLRGDRPNIAPVNDPIGAVVWGLDASNVDWVFVAGRPVMRAGVLQADVARARDLVTEAAQRVGGASGPLTGTGAGGGR